MPKKDNMIDEIDTRIELPRVLRKKQYTILANELIEQIQKSTIESKKRDLLNSIANHKFSI